MSETPWHTVTIRVPFANPKHATIAMQVIDVDPELQREAVKRTLTVDGNDLVASFATSTVRLARLTTNGFLENVDLIARTIGEFGEDSERKQVISR
ncbi:transcription factor Pcc1-domain-containing protein [Suillus placidus]|uniref:Transcription factor Pcc1-domain-containing protein n=1 Tax=Suillus placidus TaxID=48579 RepID=A0A9P7A3F2_9AGAM|nr:transcription factor Pcc1-domain-containing protein [Suillus placidus]